MRGKVHVNVTLRPVLVTTVAMGKQLNVSYSGYMFVALLIQQANRMRRVILSVACLSLPQFCSHYLLNSKIFRKKKLQKIKCAFSFSMQFFSETFLVTRRIQREIIINVHRSACKILVILVRI
jgi:hypothetical protein